MHYYAGKADGQYGQDTAEAVWAFKEAQGLPMNAATNTLVTRAFRLALIHPRAPKVLVRQGRRATGSRSTRTTSCSSCTGITRSG